MKVYLHSNGIKAGQIKSQMIETHEVECSLCDESFPLYEDALEASTEIMDHFKDEHAILPTWTTGIEK